MQECIEEGLELDAGTLYLTHLAMHYDEPVTLAELEDYLQQYEGRVRPAADGLTLVVVTHEMGFAREVANRIIFIDEGIVKVDKPPKEFFANPENERLKAFLSKVL